MEAKFENQVVGVLKEKGYKFKLDLEEAYRFAEKLLSVLAGYDSNITVLEETRIPVVIIRLHNNYIVYITVLGSRLYLSLPLAYRLISDVSGMLEVAAQVMNPVLLVHDYKGIMSSATYLYFGKVIERGIFRLLFINGGFGEVLEIVWSLENAGKYVPKEEDYEKIDLPLV